jgi:hypothetical protein
VTIPAGNAATDVRAVDTCSAADGPPPLALLPAGTRKLIALLDVLIAAKEARAA